MVQGVRRLHPLVSEVVGTILEFSEGWASGLEEAFQAVPLESKLNSSSASPCGSCMASSKLFYLFQAQLLLIFKNWAKGLLIKYGRI